MKKRIITVVFLITTFFLLGQSADQIKQAKALFKKSGMTKEQAVNAAKSRGYSDSEINKVIESNRDASAENTVDIQIKSIDPVKTFENESSNNIQSPENNNFVNSVEKNKELDQELDIIEDNFNLFSKSIGDKESLKYFGYDIFEKDPSLFQSSSMGVVDPGYLIGPGDEIIVMMWGETQFRQVLSVDREGFVFIPDIGQVFVNGLNLNLLESKLFKVLSQSYASLNPVDRKATTFLDVSLGDLRPLRVQVLGEVSQPGAFTVSPSTTLFSSLYYFNGPTILGSLRDLRLIRNGKLITSIDFYDYLLTGERVNDEKLQLDDVIFIPHRNNTISIEGAINRGGVYELLKGETLEDLIKIAGNLKISAYLGRAQIDRIVPFEKREELEMDRMLIDVNLDKTLNPNSSIELKDGDKVKIFSVLDSRQNFIYIEGAVTRPGSYEIGKSLTLSQLIVKADSLLGDAYLEENEIIRLNPDFTEELIKVNLQKALNGDLDHDIQLMPMDRVKVFSKSEMIPRQYVSVVGNVKMPGRYFLQKNMTLYDILFKAGGFFDKTHLKSTYLNRAELVRENEKDKTKEIINFNLELVLEKRGKSGLQLKSNDLVRIYSSDEILGGKNYVNIEGHVKYPGKYELFEKNMKISDLLFVSGGFEDPKHKAKTYLGRADLIRFNKNYQTKKISSFSIEDVIEGKLQSDFVLKPNDLIRVYSKKVFNQSKTVKINGSVNNPGEYIHKIDMDLKDLLLEAGGFSKKSYSYRVDISRIDSTGNDGYNFANSTTLFLSKDYNYLKKDIEGVFRFFLEPYDVISIMPDPFFELQKTVEILGAVHYPGTYTILNSTETIYDIINRAGGLRDFAHADASVFFRSDEKANIRLSKVLKNPRSKYNFIVQDKDKIEISKFTNIVKISGEINVPGSYTYIKGQRIKDLIDISGGVTRNADEKEIYITHANGISKRYKPFFGNHKLVDGSSVFVGSLPEQEPFNRTEYFKELSSIVANVAQAVSLILIAKQ